MVCRAYVPDGSNAYVEALGEQHPIWAVEMKPFKVGRVSMSITPHDTYVLLYSNGHQFSGVVQTAGAVEWALASFPNALITMRDYLNPDEGEIVIQERS